jgi:hypothetical protein
MKCQSSRKILFAPALLVGVVSVVGCNGIGAPPSTVATDTTSSRQLPFSENRPAVVPANTVIYVRLQQALSSSSAQTGQTFAAVLDEPLLVEDQTVAPKGAEITGKVLAARESGRLRKAGYVRITLSAITVNGRTFPLQTTSVIAAGGSLRNRNLSVIGGGTANTFATEEKAAGFTSERRLGFRLTQPLEIATGS